MKSQIEMQIERQIERTFAMQTNKHDRARITMPCVLCALALAAAAAFAPAQARSHDVLAPARAKAEAENQRVLLYLTGGTPSVDVALRQAISNYRVLGKLIKYEYQLVAVPSSSASGKAVRARLGCGELRASALLVLDTRDAVLATFSPSDLVEGAEFDAARVRRILQKHVCSPVDARRMLGGALATAKRTGRQVMVYLSAPW